MQLTNSPSLCSFTSEPEEKPANIGHVEAGLFLVAANAILWTCVIILARALF